WADAEHISLVIFQGAGNRAFCAGGDIRELYDVLAEEGDPDVPAGFFVNEYRMDYTIHRFPKPVVAIGHGVVMGGGLGIFSACRYRLVTP
ncbi:enoyl-CoA hydratase/isomerase family protein, partial [Klebsiella pneumoniae]|uniref:enoyl-CoA hydratase/isomerase family protein n=1 Tax=Klebsiella pneumoniae TaxID=573 RepID=UPI00301320E6